MRRVPHRIAVIGCGDIARTGHVPAIMAHPSFQPVALCDIDESRAASLAARYAIAAVTTDYRDLLSANDIDAVIVTAHPEHSVGIAVDAMNAGKAVLDEKPIATTLDGADRLQRAVHRTGAVYQIGFCLRPCPWVQGVAGLAQSLGTPSITEIALYDERLDRDNREHYAKIQGILTHSSAITHEASHIVDYARLWIEADPVALHAHAMRTDTELAGPNLWKVQISMRDGSLLCMAIGWMLKDLPRSRVRVVGPRGWMDVGIYDGVGACVEEGEKTGVELPGLAANWQAQLDLFDQSIREGRVLGPSAEDGIYALRITTACERSASTHAGMELQSADYGRAD